MVERPGVPGVGQRTLVTTTSVRSRQAEEEEKSVRHIVENMFMTIQENGDWYFKQKQSPALSAENPSLMME